MKFFTRFEPPKSPTVKAVGGLTEQHFKDECDLNVILKRFRATGIPPPSVAPVYADLTEFPHDLCDAWEKVQVVHEWFASLPSQVREKYHNDPLSAWNLIKSNPRAAVEEGLLPSSRASDAVPNHSKAAEAAKPEPPKPEAAKTPEGGVETPPEPPKA